MVLGFVEPEFESDKHVCWLGALPDARAYFDTDDLLRSDNVTADTLPDNVDDADAGTPLDVRL